MFFQNWAPEIFSSEFVQLFKHQVKLGRKEESTQDPKWYVMCDGSWTEESGNKLGKEL